MWKGKKIKDTIIGVDLSDKPDVTAKGNEAKVIKYDYRGTHYLKDIK